MELDDIASELTKWVNSSESDSNSCRRNLATIVY